MRGGQIFRWSVATLLVAATGVTFGPLALRRDRVDFTWAGSFGEGRLDEPIGIAYSEGRLWVTDATGDRVVVFDTTGAVLAEVGGAEAELGRPGRVLGGRLHYPTDVATGDSLIYVADAYNHRIQVFKPDGSHVRRWGGPLGLGFPGPFRGWFSVATGIELSPGRLYVADFFNDRIQIFTREGRYLGRHSDSLRLPTDVAATPGGTLYVVDFGHKRIVRLRPSPHPPSHP